MLLAPATAPATPGTSTSSSSSSPSTSAGPIAPVLAAGPDEARLRTAMADRLRQLAPRHTPVLLPQDDADIAAAATTPGYAAAVGSMIAVAADDAPAVDGRADIAWPVADRLTGTVEKRLDAMYAGRLAAVVVNRSTLPTVPGRVGAAARTASGTGLLLVEDSVSGPAAAAVAADSPSRAVAMEQVVAASATVLGDSPGIARSMLVALPRGTDPAPDALAALLSTMGRVPWLMPTSLTSLLTEVHAARPRSMTTTSLGAAATPLVAAVATRYSTLRSMAVVGGEIRADGTPVAARWSAAVDALLSAGWRGRVAAWHTLEGAVSQQVDATVSSVHVAPQTINFLADRGRVQLTVVNTLPVAVQNLTVELTPDSPRLRIDTSPAPIRIGAHSLTTIGVNVTALAAGPVRLTARIYGPGHVEVGREAVVQVQVTPTGSWIYWGLGGIAGLFFLLGLWRNWRRRPHRRRRRQGGGGRPAPVGSPDVVAEEHVR